MEKNIYGKIGTIATNVIAQTNCTPLQNAYAIGFDYLTGRAVRLMINTQGELRLMESLGVKQGNNEIRAVFVFI